MIARWRFSLGLLVATGALLLIALTGGGWLALDRLDPLLAVPGAGLAAMLGAIVSGLQRWRSALRWALLAWLFFAVAALAPSALLGLSNWPPIAFGAYVGAMAIAVLAAALIASLLHGRRWLLAACTIVVAVGWQAVSWQWIPPLYELHVAEPKPRVLLVSGLPLVDVAGQLPTEPFVQRLNAETRLTIRDAVTAPDLHQTDVLLLVQPQAMSPEQLVRIDTWMRAGGNAVILADGLSVWPRRYPVGDRRNPPVTSLLTPLLSHWGLRLDAPPGLAVRRHIVDEMMFQRLILLAPGRFIADQSPRAGDDCSTGNHGFTALCRVGRGNVFLVADADFLQDQLWQGQPRSRGLGAASASSMEWLLHRITARHVRLTQPAAHPVWWHCNDCTP